MRTDNVIPAVSLSTAELADQTRLAPHKVWQGEPFPNSAPTTARVLGCALCSSRVFVMVPTELSFLTVQPLRARG